MLSYLAAGAIIIYSIIHAINNIRLINYYLSKTILMITPKYVSNEPPMFLSERMKSKQLQRKVYGTTTPVLSDVKTHWSYYTEDIDPANTLYCHTNPITLILKENGFNMAKCLIVYGMIMLFMTIPTLFSDSPLLPENDSPIVGLVMMSASLIHYSVTWYSLKVQDQLKIRYVATRYDFKNKLIPSNN